MWLLSTDTLELQEFIGSEIPPYAILSHTWGPEEISFVEMKKPKYRKRARQKKGFSKIEGCCARAKENMYAWVWVDSCCIDKQSSAELSEALNSMFQWYKSSDACYVYLSDVPNNKQDMQMLRESRWFTRGWTLQELLAPLNIGFYAQDWSLLGYMGMFYELSFWSSIGNIDANQSSTLSFFKNLTNIVSEITGIPTKFLAKEKRLDQACVSQRMYWASHRTTTRPEDRAYSLMGLFDINMPIIYGEGLEKAFARLQQVICNTTPDQSIFAWHRSDLTSYRLLADSPDCFQNSGDVVRFGPVIKLGSASVNIRSAFYMTNLGLRITIPLCIEEIKDHDNRKEKVHAKIQCFVKSQYGSHRQLSLSLTYLDTDLGGRAIYMCERPNRWTFSNEQGLPTSIFIRGVNVDITNSDETSRTSAVQPEHLSAAVLDIISNATHFGSSEDPRQCIEDKMTFSDLGVDSMILIEIIFRIKSDLGLEVDIQDFYDHPTVGEFRDFVSSVARTHSRKLLKKIADLL